MIHQYKQFTYHILSPKDKTELLFLLDDVKNPIDAIINDKTYHEWNSATIDEITKNKLSIIIRNSITNQMVGYMLLKDFTSKSSKKEIQISEESSCIQKYNNLLNELESPIHHLKSKIKPKQVVKLIDSGVSREYLKNGIAIHSLKWVVNYVRNLGFKFLLVEALSQPGVKLAKNMGNQILNEICVENFEGFEHLKNFKIQLTFQKFTNLKCKL